MVERRHKPIVNTLVKMTNDGWTNWVNNLPAVAWVTLQLVSVPENPLFSQLRPRSLTYRDGLTDLEDSALDKVHSTGDLLAMRARQLQRRDEDLEEAAPYL